MFQYFETYIPTLHPHIESLNSIKLFSFEGQNLSLNNSFLDLIVLYDIFDRKNKLKACLFTDSELKEINPIYDSFNRIKEVYFFDYEEAFAKLNILKQTSIQEIEDLGIGKMNEEDFEQITYQLLNYKINILKYDRIGSWESVSDQALENISKINPRELYQLFIYLKIILILNIEININFTI